jgi:hypothetical protein
MTLNMTTVYGWMTLTLVCLGSYELLFASLLVGCMTLIAGTGVGLVWVKQKR